MSEEPKFTDKVLPPIDYESQDKNSIIESAQTAQEKILNGLSDSMAEVTLENIKKLAPLDKFEIGGVEYTRKKITPKNLRKLRKAEKDYLAKVKGLEDNDQKVEKEYELLAIKAEIYFGMTTEQFEETDIEYLNQVLQATEFRSQGFFRL